MFCKNCGKEIDDKASICVHCGVEVEKKETKKNTLALIGFIFSLIFPIVGLICSILAKNKVEECNGDGKGFATAGIIISIVSIVLSIIIGAIYGAMLGELMTYYY